MKSAAIIIAVLLPILCSAKVAPENLAEVFCKAKYEKFRDGSSLYTDSGVDVELNKVPEQYKKNKITKIAYGSKEPVKFKVKTDGAVLIVVHVSVCEKYTSDGWEKKEEIEYIDNNTVKNSKKTYDGKLVIFSKHYVKGEYEMKAEPPFGLHLVM